jgi:signal recognition particle receptor subunit beta
VLLLGAEGVGKTSIVRQLQTGGFEACTAPQHGINVSTVTISVGERDAVIDLWDVGLLADEGVVLPLLEEGALRVLLAVDRGRPDTVAYALERLSWVRSQIRGPAPGFLLIVNKSDLAGLPELPIAGTALAELPRYELSALSGEGVRALFRLLAEVALDS